MAVALSVVACVAYAAQAPVAEPRPPAVTVISAQAGPITETIVVTGTLVAREEVTISPQIDNLAIVTILAEEGDRVQAGQILARLADDALRASMAQNAAQIDRARAAIAQAEGAINEAQANRAQADAAFGRTRDLVGSGAASRETFDLRQAAAQTSQARVVSAQAALRVAQADLALALAQRQELQVRLSQTEIKAPVAGIINRRTARLGVTVSMIGEPLFRLIIDGAIDVEGDVPEQFLVRMAVGQPAWIKAAGGVVRQGIVRLVAPEVNRTTRLGRVRIAATGEGLLVGGFARATVVVAHADGVLVPQSAVQMGPDGPLVSVVRDGVVDQRPVKLGLRAEGQVQIVSGLAEGDRVIAISGTFLRTGDHVIAVPTPPLPPLAAH